jgi:hypothetical protein
MEAEENTPSRSQIEISAYPPDMLGFIVTKLHENVPFGKLPEP